jgi:hypothetical protein
MRAESGERGEGEAVEVHEGGEGNNDLDMIKVSIFLLSPFEISTFFKNVMRGILCSN